VSAPSNKLAALEAVPASLSPRQRWLVLVVAFLAWMFAGLEISSFVLISRPAMKDFLDRQQTDEPAASLSPTTVGAPSEASAADREKLIGKWFAWFQAAFLFGAAGGGWLFGAMGDRLGRVKALSVSIFCYSAITGLSYFVHDAPTLLVFRFVACLGVGGAWPNAVALVAEAWPDVSRPMLAGLLGTAANVGFVLLGLIGCAVPITQSDWRWVLLVGAAPLLLTPFAWWLPESPRWLASRLLASKAKPGVWQRGELLRPPLLNRTLLGICLGAVPVVGTAASANWVVVWADKAAEQSHVDRSRLLVPAGSSVVETKETKESSAAKLKAWTQVTRSTGAMLGSLLGGWLASLLGRRLTYFLISLVTFAASEYLYLFLTPLSSQFQPLTFLLGFAGVTYFGWLPLYLPELFPTHVRATGSGIAFNFGRIIAGVAVMGAGSLIQMFGGDYGRLGAWTSLIYAVGMAIIIFAPDTAGKKLED